MVQHRQPSSSQHGHFSSLWTKTMGIPFPAFGQKSILVAVMGMTGAGKTYFIKQITGLDEMEVGHGLESCTKEFQVATTQIDGCTVHLIDTPGFNDDELKDTDILLEIAEYLQTGVQLSAVLYLHPINDSRLGGTGKRNLELLQNLVGRENMGNVKLVTTKGSRATDEERGTRLDDLVSKFWKGMITAGAQVDHYDGSTEDGKRIVGSVLRSSPVKLLFQQELQDGSEVEQTSAGKSLMEAFIRLQERYEKELKELKETHEMYEEALRKRDETAEQARKLHETRIKGLEEKIGKMWDCAVM
ncbi:P-loop containing nucleoside triphosphate hydrolase protein [Paraphoma chrysanthemicola]|uniref:P-loop containing nucleoside triphosphate hydrolase protein n=1 Tax=Paraphoma chrysanthemicola TaxID=798071 RepID=A0A8K0W685_9PLEO|nr:P-loop containing nucleoside triphosphate hydrolase protein [Paraphoma chrysanthemicola]